VKPLVWRLASIALALVAYEILLGALDATRAGAVLLSSGAHPSILALLGTASLAVLRFALIVLAPSVWAYDLVGFAFALRRRS
jgi:hypothetical protein